MRIAATTATASMLHMLLNLLRVLLLLLLHHRVLLKVVLLLPWMLKVLRGMHMLLVVRMLMGNVGKLLLRLVWIRRNGLSWCRRPRCSRSLGSYWAIVGRTRNASTGTRRPPLAGDHAGLWAVDAKLRVVARTVTRCGAAILGRAPRVTWPHCRHGPLNDISSGRPRCSLRDLSRDGSSGAGESRGSRWRVHGQRARHRGSHARLLGLGRALLVLRRPYAAWRHRALRWWLHSHRAERVVVLIEGHGIV